MTSHEGLMYAACVLRCFGFIVSLPFGEAIQSFPRFFLSVGLGIALFPVASISGDLTPFSLIVEFVIGFIRGAPLRLISDVSEMIGELVDTARGQTISSVIDPLHGQGNSDLGVVAKNGAVVCALYLGALEISLGGLARSVHAIPLGASFVEESFARGLVRSLTFLVVEGMRVCAVWMGAFLVIDLGCALASRLLSGLSFTQTGGILKMLVTFILMMVVVTEGARLSLGDLKRALVPWWSASVVPRQVNVVSLPPRPSKPLKRGPP